MEEVISIRENIRERYKELFNNSLELIYVIDINGNFIDANDIALEIFGYKREEIADIKFEDLLDQGQTEKIFNGLVSTKLPIDIQRTARRKLFYLDDAEDLLDLRAPPGKRLEKLKGERSGQYSIRINDQWRICFQWIANSAQDVEIVDYHS